MARYSTAARIESEIWEMRMADIPRSNNRALVDSLFNGNPPFSEDERKEIGVKTNVNFLESTKIAHDARRQFSNAFLTPGNFFTVQVDGGPAWKRGEWGEIITAEINRRMKKSLAYQETLKSVFAQLVLHGVGPAVWSGKEKWVPSMQSMADVLIPSRTLRSFENLTKFAIRRRYTAEELWKLTHGPKVDKAWNMEVVNKSIKWARQQLYSSTADINSVENPEVVEQDFKENCGAFSCDAIPTIDAWDFFFLDDAEKNFGWKRRIILDCADNGQKNILGGNNEFLYNSGSRNYAGNLSEILHCQFADGSAVAPFRYHSVRSLGFLLYSVCHLQNRLRCKLNDSAFESLIQFLRVSNPDDAERVLKLTLMDKGIIPDGVSFVGQNDRWKPPMDLVMTVAQLNRQNMEDNSTSFTQDFNFAKDQVEKTATQVTAEVTASSALVSTMLQEAYSYQEFQYGEIARRFCRVASKDPDCNAFRKACLKRGVPEDVLDNNRWIIKAERVIGGGNKQMELAQISMLMQDYNRYSPDAQRLILRKKTMAVTDDPALTNQLVPFEPNRVSDSKHDAQLAIGTLMLGLPVDVKPTTNQIDYVENLLMGLTLLIQQIEQTTPGMTTQEKVVGLQNLANHISQHIEIIAQDENEKPRVKQYQDALSQAVNYIKGYMQRLEEQASAQGGDPEVAANIQAKLIEAQSKAKISEASAMQKLKHKELSFQQKTEQAQVKSQLDNANTIRRTQVDEASADLKTAAEIQRQDAKAASEPKEEGASGESTKPAESKPASQPAKKKKRTVTFKRENGKISGFEEERE